MSEDQKSELTAQEVSQLGEVIEELLEIAIEEANERIANKTGGQRVSFSDRVKLDMVKRTMQIAKKYNSEARFAKAVEHSNTVLPTLTKLFGDEALTSRVPAKAKDAQIIELCDKAGATELSGLITRSMAGPA